MMRAAMNGNGSRRRSSRFLGRFGLALALGGTPVAVGFEDPRPGFYQTLRIEKTKGSGLPTRRRLAETGKRKLKGNK